MTDYKLIIKQMEALANDSSDPVPLMANVSALLFHAMEDVNWAGFYLVKEDALILGPFQGKVACVRIEKGRGVCGTAWAEDRPQLVPDVHAFAGHIACDSESRSEIVVPIHRDGPVFAVLDIDSPIPARFSEDDRAGLVELVSALEQIIRREKTIGIPAGRGHMHHCGTKTIETDRLVLRKIRLSDAAAAYKNWTSDERVTEFLRWPAHSDISVTERVFKEWTSRYEEPDFYQWAIVLKEIEEPVGTIGVVDLKESLDLVHIGYCIGSRWWHQGITSEALKAVIPFLFDEVNVNRIEAMHDPDNPHSGDVMKKCGLKYEGTLQQADYSNKGIVDAAMYRLLKSEWKEKKQQV